MNQSSFLPRVIRIQMNIHKTIALISPIPFLLLLIIHSILLPQTMSSTADSNNNKLPSTSRQHLQKRGKIILLGDSITQMSTSAKLSGWGSYIADIYQRRCDVYNRGMSGYNTKWFLKYLDSESGYEDVFGMMKSKGNNGHGSYDESSVKLVTIFFGANDASSSILNPRHHIPIPEFKTNLKTIIQKCIQHYSSNIKIVLITPPPVCHASRLEYQIQRYKDKATGILERTLELSGEYANAVVEVGKEVDAHVLNIWELMQSSIGGSNDDENKKDGNDSTADTTATAIKKHPWSIYLSDGLHLSREGNLFVGEELTKLINKEFPDIAVTPCPYTDYTGNSSSKGGVGLGSVEGGGIGPWHDEIDYLNADKAFEVAGIGTPSSKKRKSSDEL